MFIVKMERWGDYENHSYLIGVFNNYMTASLEGQNHRQYRGGKYEPKIIALDIEGKLDKKYYIASVFDNDRKKLEFKVLNTEARSRGFREHMLETRKMDIDKFTVQRHISDETMLELHHYLNWFNNEQLEYLRDRYERYIRRTYNPNS